MLIKINKQEVELPDGSSGKDLAEKLNLRGPDQSLAIKINGRLCDLSTPLKNGDEAELLHFEDPEGKEIYWHTSAHVLAQAVLRLYQSVKPTIGPPIVFKEVYPFGIFLGFGLSAEKGLNINFEVRFINENAVSASGDFKF